VKKTASKESEYEDILAEKSVEDNMWAKNYCDLVIYNSRVDNFVKAS
jgi:hypothetical protein